MLSAECLRRELADEVRYSILPILIGEGIRFFEELDRDVALHLAEVKGYKSGMVGLRYEVQTRRHTTPRPPRAQSSKVRPAPPPAACAGVRSTSRA